MFYGHGLGQGEEEREETEEKLEEVGPQVEFYPVDPLSREMVDRLRVFSTSLSNMVYLPSEDDASPYLRRNNEMYQVKNNNVINLYLTP